MGEIRKRKWGDRKDGFRVKDTRGLQSIMPHLMPKRTESEVFLHDKFDITDLLKYIEKKNEQYKLEGKDYKLTLFHCIVTALNRMVRERPIMNRFIQGRRLYQRYEVSSSFVAKKRFTDHAEESLMFIVFKDNDTVDDVAKKIVGDVKETRKTEDANNDVDSLMKALKRMPNFLLAWICHIVKRLDFFGHNPDFITRGDPNYSSIFLSNLGSIKCPAVYHHLNNYGTNSFMVTIGTIHKEEIIANDGTKQIRDVVDYGATLDERIGDGFYFARSLKLVNYICSHPELLDKPLGEPSEFDYK